MIWRSSAAKKHAPLVLLVDDDEQLRNGLARLLRAEDLLVVTVPSALHALQVLDQVVVDLIVSDMRMRGPNGLKLLETVRDQYPETRRMMLTAYVTAEIRASPAVDTVLDKGEDAAFVIDSIVNEARLRNGEGR